MLGCCSQGKSQWEMSRSSPAPGDLSVLYWRLEVDINTQKVNESCLISSLELWSAVVQYCNCMLETGDENILMRLTGHCNTVLPRLSLMLFES